MNWRKLNDFPLSGFPKQCKDLKVNICGTPTLTVTKCTHFWVFMLLLKATYKGNAAVHAHTKP